MSQGEGGIVEVEEGMTMPGLETPATVDGTERRSRKKPKTSHTSAEPAAKMAPRKRTREPAPGTPAVGTPAVAAAPVTPSPAPTTPASVSAPKAMQKAADAMAKHTHNTDIIRVLQGQSTKADLYQAKRHVENITNKGFLEDGTLLSARLRACNAAMQLMLCQDTNARVPWEQMVAALLKCFLSSRRKGLDAT